MPAGLIAAGIGAATSLLGGSRSNKENAKLMAQQMAFQKEFAQHGVRWRVEDAKAAGLHPLYALGAQLPSGQPMVIPDAMGPAIAEAGQNVSRAIAAGMTAQERQAHAAGLALTAANTRAANAQAGYYDTLAMRNFQEMNQSAGLGGPTAAGTVLPEGQAPQTGVGLVNLVPPDVGTSSGDPGVQAGVGEMWQRWRLADDLQVVLPATLSGSPSEALESLSESALLMALVAQENRRRFGDENWNRFLERYAGSTAARRAQGKYVGPLTQRANERALEAIRRLSQQ